MSDKMKIKLIRLLMAWGLVLFFIGLAYSVDGPLNVEHPAEVTGVSVPDEINGVTGLATGGSDPCAGAGVLLCLDENDMGSTPSGWVDNGSGGTLDWNFTDPVHGLTSLHINESTGDVDTISGTSSITDADDGLYVFAIIVFQSVSNITNQNTFALVDTGGTARAMCRINISGADIDFFPRLNATSGTATVNKAAEDTILAVWMDYDDTNNTLEVAFSTLSSLTQAASKPTSGDYFSSVTYSSAYTIDRIQIFSSNSAVDFSIVRIVVSNVEITGNPWSS